MGTHAATAPSGNPTATALVAAMVAQLGAAGLIPRTEGTLRGSSAAHAASNAVEEAMAIPSAIVAIGINIGVPEMAIQAAAREVQEGGGFTGAVLQRLVMQLGVHAATTLASQLANAACPKRAPRDTAAKDTADAAQSTESVLELTKEFKYEHSHQHMTPVRFVG